MENISRDDFGRFLNIFLVDNKIPVRKAAKVIGCPEATMRRILTGETKPADSMLKQGCVMIELGIKRYSKLSNAEKEKILERIGAIGGGALGFNVVAAAVSTSGVPAGTISGLVVIGSRIEQFDEWIYYSYIKGVKEGNINFIPEGDSVAFEPFALCISGEIFPIDICDFYIDEKKIILKKLLDMIKDAVDKSPNLRDGSTENKEAITQFIKESIWHGKKMVRITNALQPLFSGAKPREDAPSLAWEICETVYRDSLKRFDPQNNYKST